MTLTNCSKLSFEWQRMLTRITYWLQQMTKIFAKGTFQEVNKRDEHNAV